MDGLHFEGEATMDEAAFQTKLTELMNEISTMPQAERDKLSVLAQETQARQAKLRKTVHDLQESLDYLRLSIKYLVFEVSLAVLRASVLPSVSFRR